MLSPLSSSVFGQLPVSSHTSCNRREASGLLSCFNMCSQCLQSSSSTSHLDDLTLGAVKIEGNVAADIDFDDTNISVVFILTGVSVNFFSSSNAPNLDPILPDFSAYRV